MLLKLSQSNRETGRLVPFRLLPLEAEIVGAIRRLGALSRTDLARMTGYSRANITSVVNNLVETGILNEVGAGDSQGGRRPRMLNFNRGLGYIVGVDVGATSIDLVIADFGGQILERRSEAADVRAGPEPLLGRICALIGDMLRRRGIPADHVYAAGVGVPGPVEFSSGLLIAPPLMPNWDGYPIRQFIQRTLPAANVFVDNDVNVMALGELRAGAGVGVDNVVFIKIGTGIGAGIVCNGKVYRGSNGCAGDIGHICVDREGRACHCGNSGCLESIAAGPPIAVRAMEAARAGASPFLARRMEANSNHLTSEDVGLGAAAGDRASIEIIRETGRVIGEALAGLVNFFNPRLILIGGGVSNIGHQLLSSLRQAVLLRSTPLSTRDLRIEYASLGADAGVTGAIWLGLEHMFIVEHHRDVQV
jgi:glucokinase-like ROK family protein